MTRHRLLFASFALLATMCSAQPVPTTPRVPGIRPGIAPKVPSPSQVTLDTSIIVPTISWGPDQDTGGRSGGISAAFYQGELLLVYKGRTSDRLYENIYGVRGGSAKWLGETRIPDQSSQDYPAIVTAGDKVVMVHTSGGEGGDHRMWLSVRDDKQWDNDTSMGQFYRSDRGPALASDDRHVYLAYKDSESNKILFDYASIPTQEQNRRIGFGNTYNLPLDGKSPETATLASRNGVVCIAYSGPDDSIWYKQTNGTPSNFDPQIMIAGIRGKAPYLVFVRDRLFLFFLSPDRQQLGYTTYTGTRWNEALYHRLPHDAHDIVVTVQPEYPDTLHLLYTAESDKRIYHSIGRVK